MMQRTKISSRRQEGLFDFGIETAEFKKVCSLIETPKNYFEFPSSLIAFGHTYKSSTLYIVENSVFFRKYGITLTLIAFTCSGKDLKRILDEHSKLFKIKVLNFVHGDTEGLNLKPYENEYWIDNTYSIEKVLEKHSSKSRSTMRRKLKRAHETYYIGSKLNEDDVFSVFYEWAEGAKRRHFMVMKGHYLAYLHQYFDCKNNVTLIPFYERTTKRLYGIAGFEMIHDVAQITVMKHRFGDNNFPAYFWVSTLEFILKNKGIQKIFCGYTADELKLSLGFNFDKSYKIIP